MTRAVAWALVGAGGVYFLAAVEIVGTGAAAKALAALGLIVLAYLIRTVDPAWLITAGILATMFAGRWADLGVNVGIAPHRIVLAAGLLAVLLRAPPARNRPPLHLDRAHFALAAALAYLVISAVFAGSLDIEEGQFVFIDQFGLLPFAMFLVAPAAFATERQRTILLGGLVAAGAYLSITAALEQLELYDLVFPGYVADPSVGVHFGRARGPFVEAAANGLALYMTAVAAAVALVRWRDPALRLAAGAVAVMAPLGLLLTVTRGAWLAGVAATLVAVATTARLRRYLAPVAVAGVLGVVLAFALVPGLSGEARERQDDKNPVYERQNTTAAGLRMVADRPFFGFGWWFSNEDMTPYYRLDPDIPLVGAQAGLHNAYLLYAVALGLVGLGVWLLAVGLVFGRALASRGPPELTPWRIGLKAVLVAWLVVALFAPANYAFSTALVWTWAGLLWPQRRAPAS